MNDTIINLTERISELYEEELIHPTTNLLALKKYKQNIAWIKKNLSSLADLEIDNPMKKYEFHAVTIIPYDENFTLYGYTKEFFEVCSQFDNAQFSMFGRRVCIQLGMTIYQ